MIEFEEKIAEHCENWYPKEACGVLAEYKSGVRWVPCTNISNSNNTFEFDPEEYRNITKRAKIIAIIHSHPDASPEPSLSDIKVCNILQVPFYIFSYPSMESYILSPEKQ